MEENTQKMIAMMGIIIFPLLILFGLIYKFSGSSGSSSSSSSSSKKKNTYQKSLSLEKLYDEAGGNDPLSDGLMTTQINVSTDKHSCGFLATYRGVNDRKVVCQTGCDTDFCKQFIYPYGDETLQDLLLDETYVKRRGKAPEVEEEVEEEDTRHCGSKVKFLGDCSDHNNAGKPQCINAYQSSDSRLCEWKDSWGFIPSFPVVGNRLFGGCEATDVTCAEMLQKSADPAATE